MTSLAATLHGLAADLGVALSFYSRLPIGTAARVEGTAIARASWAAPVVGAGIGGCGALTYWIAHAAGMPPLVGAALALAATAVLTGCLHEDGLADTADGLGGGATRERKLEIMRDSRIGTYGVCALTLALLARAGAVAALAEPVLVASALIAAHAAARAALPVLMRIVPPARRDGLAAQAGAPPRMSVLAAIAIGVAALLLAVGVAKAIIAVVLACLVSALIGFLCIRQIGGQTGDVLGAVEQANEIAVLAAALVRP
jgi:adenosylcobinamide-GDP ribazoletransferase